MKRRTCSIISRIIIAFFISSTISCDSSIYKSAWQNTIDTVKDQTKSIKDKAESLISEKSSDADKQMAIMSSKDLQMRVDRGRISPDSLARSLEIQSKKDYNDYLDLGTCYVWNGKYDRAGEAYEMAARHAKTTNELTGALHNKAISLAYVNINKSLPAIDLASRVSPKNLEVARLRVALHQKSSNQIGQIAAKNHLSSLDSSVMGHEVMEPFTTSAIIILGTVAILSMTTITVYALTPPENRAEIVVPMMEGFYGTVSSTSRGTDTFGSKLLGGKI